jgi:hypothetical protein
VPVEGIAETDLVVVSGTSDADPLPAGRVRITGSSGALPAQTTGDGGPESHSLIPHSGPPVLSTPVGWDIEGEPA